MLSIQGHSSGQQPVFVDIELQGGNSIDFKNRPSRLPKVGCTQKYPFGAFLGAPNFRYPIWAILKSIELPPRRPNAGDGE